jgi:Tfp pilus assembly protein PilX
MRRHSDQGGFALILLIGIMAALAILASMLVVMLDNQQHATSKERSSKTSLYYADAALSSAASAAENDTTWLTNSAYTVSQSTYNADYASLSGAPTATYTVYDNLSPTNTAVTYDSNGDGEVWVQASVTWNRKTSTVRELVSSATKTSILPKAAAWTDTNMTLNDSSNIYGVQNNGQPDDSGAPYVTSIMCGGNFHGNGSTNLAYPGHTVQSLGLQINGTEAGTPTLSWTKGGVGLLSDYFDQAHQAALMTQAQLAIANQSTLFASSGTNATSTTTPYTTWTSTSSQTWTAPSGTNYVVPSSCNSGNLTIAPASGKVSTFTFNKLWVAGNLTISGNATVNTTGLYVGGNLTITGTTAASITDDLGPIYVAGKVLWEGAFNSNTTTLNISTATTAAPTSPQPMFCKILSVDGDLISGSADNSTYDTTNKPGPTTITLGDLWVDGDAGTGDIAVNFSGPSAVASTVMCTVLATTEQTHWNGYVNCGTIAQPMVYFMQCDNDNLYSNHMEYSSTGTYTGLMILFEAEAYINSGSIVGAVMEGTPYVSGTDTGTDLTLSGSSTICYNQTVINNCTSDSLTTTSTGVVAGSWQQLTSY